MDVLQSIKTDREAREPGNEDKRIVYSYKEELKRQEWVDELPTLVHWKKKSLDVNNLPTEKQVLETLFNKHPVLEQLDYTNLAVAGGIIARAVMGEVKTTSDVDIFIHSAKEEDLPHILEKTVKTITKFVKDRLSTCRKTYELRNFSIVRTKNAITIGGVYQIILRSYTNVPEILYGFDLGSAAIAYDGKGLVVSEMGKLAYSSLINVVDLSRRSTTYERRINKYMEMGFKTVLPNLNMEALSDHKWRKFKILEIAELEMFTFSHRKIEGNRIVYRERVGNFDLEPISDYSGETNEYDDVNFAMTYNNLNKVVNSENPSFIVKHGDPDVILHPMEWISHYMIRGFYENLFDKFKRGLIRIPTIKRYMPWIDPTELCAKYDDEAFVDGLCKDTIKKVTDMCDAVKDHGVVFMTTDPGTQLTSSYNPVVTDPAEWYGEKYYLADK